VNQVLLYVGSGLLALWGLAHVFATRGAVEGFGDLSADNARILAMEWINEGATLVFLGLLTAAVTFVGPIGSRMARTVFVLVSVALNVLSGISLFTGFRVRFLPYKLCPAIFTGASILILLGAFL